MNKGVVWCILVCVIMLVSASGLSAREMRVLIFDFDTHAAEDVQHLRSGVSALLPSRIAAPKSIVVIDASSVYQLLPRGVQHLTVQDKLATAKKLSADYVLSGSITKIGSVISIDATLLDVRTGKPCLPLTVQCDGLNAVIPELSRFAQAVKEKIMQEANPQLEEADLPVSHRETTVTSSVDEERLQVPEDVSPDEPPAQPVRRQRRHAAPKPTKPAFVMPKPFFSSEPVFTYDIPGKSLLGLAAGDVNGDGSRELLVAGQDEIHIFKVDGKTLTPCGTLSAGTDEHIVQVDVADMNHNGIDEIYVSSYEGHYANSFVLEYTQGEYRRLATGQKLFFRVYTPADDNATLLGQEASLANPFAGTLFHFEWRDGKPLSRDEFLMPGGAGIYSFAEGYLDEQGDKVYFVFSKGFLGFDYRFSMLSGTGKTLWRDTMNLGGTPNYFIQSLYSDEIQQQQFVPLRIIADEFGSRGRLGVIVGRNSKAGSGIIKKLMSYNQSEVLCLVWNGADFVVNWTTGVMQGYTADYYLTDFDQDGKRELSVLTVASTGMFGKATNRITVYRAVE